MSADFLVFAALALFAILFVVLPLLIKTGDKGGEDGVIQSHLNQKLFEENLQQLQEQLDNSEISEKSFAKLKQELEKQLEQDQKIQSQFTGRLSKNGVRGVYAAAVVVLPLLALMFYQQWGARPDWEIYQANLNKVRQQERGASQEELRVLNKELERMLEDRLQQRGDNLHNRFLLARIYSEMEEYKNSLEMYQAILDERPQSPDVVSEMAQVLYIASGGQFTAEVKNMYDRAIQMQPQNIRTISFAGISAFQAGAYQEALEYWQMGISLSEPNSRQYQTMLQALAETKKRLQAAGMEPETEAGEEVAAADNAGLDKPTLKVNVALGEDLALDPGLRVFVYARAWQGPPMPLAVRDLKVADLPLTITLDESMNPGMPMKLSQFSQWELVARVSRSGSANAQSGDWQEAIGPITEAQSDEVFQLVITSQIP